MNGTVSLNFFRVLLSEKPFLVADETLARYVLRQLLPFCQPFQPHAEEAVIDEIVAIGGVIDKLLVLQRT